MDKGTRENCFVVDGYGPEEQDWVWVEEKQDPAKFAQHFRKLQRQNPRLPRRDIFSQEMMLGGVKRVMLHTFLEMEQGSLLMASTEHT